MTETQIATLFAHSKDALVAAREQFDSLTETIKETHPDLYRDLVIAHGGEDLTTPGSSGSRPQRADAVKRICQRNWSADVPDEENIWRISELLHLLSFYAAQSSDTYQPILRQAVRAGLITEAQA